MRHQRYLGVISKTVAANLQFVVLPDVAMLRFLLLAKPLRHISAHININITILKTKNTQ